MKQIVVISGKGGTGKTIFTGALAVLAESKVLADCDVDAADLFLLFPPEIQREESFSAGFVPVIDYEKCTKCGLCSQLCRFDAINTEIVIDYYSCEGCAFCANICPAEAVKMEPNVCGKMFVSKTRAGSMVHAKLGTAQENSGKLVSLVRKTAGEIAEEENKDWVIIDGSPGIGCAVIASLAGADCAIVVTEPTLSGLHDAGRVIKVAKHFSIPAKLVINKFDLNREITEKIEIYCKENNIETVGKIPFDKSVVTALVEGMTIIEHDPNSAVSKSIKEIWVEIMDNV